jgi:transposase
MENRIRLTRTLIVGHGRDGRCLYDPEAKRELVKACLPPGTSIAKAALDHGINANLLRKWISQYADSSLSNTQPSSALPAFAPVLSLSTSNSVKPFLSAVLPNGVKIELQYVALSNLPLLLNALAALPCSVSNPS